MNYTERDEKHDTPLDEQAPADRERAEQDAEENDPKHKAPFMPSSSDDSPLGSTDQHSDA